jgi:hypothetical protein
MNHGKDLGDDSFMIPKPNGTNRPRRKRTNAKFFRGMIPTIEGQN